MKSNKQFENAVNDILSIIPKIYKKIVKKDIEIIYKMGFRDGIIKAEKIIQETYGKVDNN